MHITSKERFKNEKVKSEDIKYGTKSDMRTFGNITGDQILLL